MSAPVSLKRPDAPLTADPVEAEIAARTDVYFRKTKAVVGGYGDKRVTYAVFMRRPVIFCPRLVVEWLQAVAKALGLTPARLRDLNPHLIQGVTPPGSSYALRVPKGSSDRVIAAMGGKPLTEIAN